jgi:hypothetical protein
MKRIYRHLKIGILVVIMVQISQYAYATGIRISWQPSEGDVAGYKVYYGTASRDYDNVIDVGNVDTVDIGDLASAGYFFALTAYNASGEESDYSEEIQASIGANGQGQVLPGGGSADPSADSAGSGSGGGGGGGCFIASSELDSPMQAMALFAFIVSVFIVHRRRRLKLH